MKDFIISITIALLAMLTFPQENMLKSVVLGLVAITIVRAAVLLWRELKDE